MDTYYKDFPNRLLEERKRLGLTQEKLGEYGGVRRAAQYLYEHGERTPSVEYLIKISKHGADFRFLLTGERSAETGGILCLEPETLQRVYVLVDQISRDSKGRLLDLEYRQELMLNLCRLVSGQHPDHINWDELQKTF